MVAEKLFSLNLQLSLFNVINNSMPGLDNKVQMIVKVSGTVSSEHINLKKVFDVGAVHATAFL